MDIDDQGSVWAAGTTRMYSHTPLNNTFPVTPNAAQPDYPTPPVTTFPPVIMSPSVIFQLSSDLSTLLYSSYFYDSTNVAPISIANLRLNRDDNVVIAGLGCPPITSNAVIPTNLMPCSSGVNGSMPFAAVISSQTGLLMASSY